MEQKVSNKKNVVIIILAIMTLVLAILALFYGYKDYKKGDTKGDINNTKACTKEDCNCKVCETCKECPAVENKWTTYVTNLKKDEEAKIIESSVDDSGNRYPISNITITKDGKAKVWFDETTATGKKLIQSTSQNYVLPVQNVIDGYFIKTMTGAGTPEAFLLLQQNGDMVDVKIETVDGVAGISTTASQYKKITSVYNSMGAGAHITMGIDIDGNVREIIIP